MSENRRVLWRAWGVVESLGKPVQTLGLILQTKNIIEK
jgi:hypothetical protein